MASLRSLPIDLTSYAIEQILSGNVIAKTDADGRFHFDCALEEKYVVATRAQRELASGKIETFQWIVNAVPSGDATRQVL